MNSNLSEQILNKASGFLKELSGDAVLIKRRLVDNVVYIAGMSGGCGASTIASNLAFLAAEKGMSVVLVDADIMYPIQHLNFGVERKLGSMDLVSLITGMSKVEESTSFSKKVALLYSSNRDVINHINCDNREVGNNINNVIDTLSELFDIVIIDGKAKVEYEVTNAFMYNSDIIYTVWDEGVQCISNCERLKRNMETVGIDSNKLRAILNKKTSVHYGRDTFKKLGVPLESVLPFDIEVIESSLRGDIFCDKGASKSETAAILDEELRKLFDRVIEIGG